MQDHNHQEGEAGEDKEARMCGCGKGGSCGCGKGGKKRCGCSHHKMGPALIFLFGLLFLLSALNVVTDGLVAVTWPIIVMLVGGLKLTSGKCKCC